MRPQVQRPTGAFTPASRAALVVGGHKGFCAMPFLPGRFGAGTVQKNVRDLALPGDEAPVQDAGA